MNQLEGKEKNTNQKFSKEILDKVSELMKNNLKLRKKEKVMEINKEELYKLYMEWVNEVSEECDWKTSFGPKEIVNAIAKIIEKNPNLVGLTNIKDENSNNWE